MPRTFAKDQNRTDVTKLEASHVTITLPRHNGIWLFYETSQNATIRPVSELAIAIVNILLSTTPSLLEQETSKSFS